VRKRIGLAAFCVLLLLGLGVRHIAGIRQDEWSPLWGMLYIVALGVAFISGFFDRKNLPEKTWDYNPKRGLLYFCLGWMIFPVMIGVEALVGTNFTLAGMLVSTLALSVLMGIAGTFTENVGV
jgi:hypothetical protein